MKPLDAFIPRYDARERHSIEVHAPAPDVFAAAEAFDFQSILPIRAIIRMREIVLRASHVAREPQPFLREAVAMGWGVLAREPGRLFIGGAWCQPWLANVKFTPIPPVQFAAFHEPNSVKIAWTLEVEPLTPKSARLSTETRVVASDSEARVRFHRYWRWARYGIVAIRWFMLPAIRRRAERFHKPDEYAQRVPRGTFE